MFWFFSPLVLAKMEFLQKKKSMDISMSDAFRKDVEGKKIASK